MFYSILLGIGNILLFSVLPILVVGIFLYVLWGKNIFDYIGFILFSFLFFNFENIFIFIGLILFLVSVILNIILIYKLFKKLYSNTSICESVVYSIFMSLSWFTVLFILTEYFGVFRPSGFISFGDIVGFFYIINIIFISILNIKFMFNAFKNNKKTLCLSFGILIQVIIPIIYIIICKLISSGFFVVPYTETEILNIINKKDNITNSIITDIEETVINMECEGNDSFCSIYMGSYNYFIEAQNITYLTNQNDAKIYTIKSNNKYYKLGTYIGSTGLIPTKRYEILDEYTATEYELELKKAEIIKEIEIIAKHYGYKENHKLIKFNKSDLFIMNVRILLEEDDDIILVNQLQYSNEFDIRFKNYEDKITINLDQYIEKQKR